MVSVIIPIFKAEEYLYRCIDSILQLRNKDWELLLIDDGSPDRSGEICDAYALKDTRIKVIHKENGGVSSARNAGLDSARGEWIAFIDADDYVSENYFDFNDSGDVILTNVGVVNLDGTVSDATPYTVDKILDYRNFLADNLINNRLRAPWGKIIKRSAIGSLRFPLNQRLGEDTVFMYHLLSKVSTISYNKEIFYFWQKGELPDTSKYCLSVKDNISYLRAIFNSYELIGIASSRAERFLVDYFFSLIDKTKPLEIKRWFDDEVIAFYLKKVYSSKIPLSFILWKRIPLIMYYLRPFYVRFRKNS